jgi:hypothetical protein
MKQIALWINKCYSMHSCKFPPFLEQIPKTTPSRLLELGQQLTNVRLIEVDTLFPHFPEYVTHLYCWGIDTSKQLKTTRSNLEVHKSRINWELIPPVVQDAIMVVKWVGQRFVWVDALCIVQDSPENKSKEISKMDSIYAYSLFAIAATKSAGVKEGFLSMEANGRGQMSGITDWFEYNQGLHAKHEVTDSISPIENGLWSKRAWTYLFTPNSPLHRRPGLLENFDC